ncbi:MAG TPA: FecR family protein [Chloroflexia bacterium]|nr:FecR family protein [Chloroflexia bacterium]
MTRARGVRLALPLALALLIGLSAACDTSSGSSGAVAPAIVQETRGSTFVCRDTFPADLTSCPPGAVGDAVVVGGGVHTGPGAATLLMLSGSTHFRLQPESTLRYVGNTGAAGSFLLAAGRVFAAHAPGDQAILIRSGDAAVTELGTLFTVGIDRAGVIVSVQAGQVAVEVPPGSRQTRTVRAGEGLLIPPGATAPPVPRPMSPGELAVWRHIGPQLQVIP